MSVWLQQRPELPQLLLWSALLGRGRVGVGYVSALRSVYLTLAELAGHGLAVGALVGQQLQPAGVPPSSVEVRVIDDGARGGPAVLATAIVPLR